MNAVVEVAGCDLTCARCEVVTTLENAFFLMNKNTTEKRMAERTISLETITKLPEISCRGIGEMSLSAIGLANRVSLFIILSPRSIPN